MSSFLQLSLNPERYISSKISVLCCFQNIMIARCVAESTSKHCAAKCRFVTPVFGKYFTYFDPIGKTLFSWNNGLCMSRWKRSNTYSFICKRGCAEGHQWSGIFFPEKKRKRIQSVQITYLATAAVNVVRIWPLFFYNGHKN